MPRTLARAGILVAVLIAPSLALAAATDVVLSNSSAQFNVNGIEVDASGTGNTFQSVAVDGTTMTFVLGSGSTFALSTPGLQRLFTDTLSGLVSDVCTGTQSVLTYNGPSSGTQTVVVQVAPSTICTSAGGSGGGGGGGGSSSGGGGGGSVAVPATPATPAIPATPTVTPATPATPATPSGGTAADKAVVKTQAATLMSVIKTKDLTVGSKSDAVTSLQTFLITQGKGKAAVALAKNGTTKYFGGLTRTALAEYQKSVGITPATGYFGAKTRAYLNSLAK